MPGKKLYDSSQEASDSDWKTVKEASDSDWEETAKEASDSDQEASDFDFDWEEIAASKRGEKALHFEGLFKIGHSELLQLYNQENNYDCPSGTFSGPNHDYFIVAGRKYRDIGTAFRNEKGEWEEGPNLNLDDALMGYGFNVKKGKKKNKVVISTEESETESLPDDKNFFHASFDCDVIRFISSANYRKLLSNQIEVSIYLETLLSIEQIGFIRAVLLG